MNSDYYPKPENEKKVKTFVKNLMEKSPEDLSKIITRYISYQPETVEAALYVSVEKGIISYDLKQLLLKQIEDNFIAHLKGIKYYKWENNNAFISYVSRYTDDEIYNIIEDTSEIVIDVYHAILMTARERELITTDEFSNFYKAARENVRTDYEILNDDIKELFRSEGSGNGIEEAAVLEAEREKLWKCPSCHQLVDMELAVCWNCQAEMPEIAEHPVMEEVIKERSEYNNYGPVKAGFILIGGGVLVTLLAFARSHSISAMQPIYFGRLVFGGFFILLGLVFIIDGIFFKSKLKEPSDL